MQLYAHNWMFKIKVIIGNLQGKSESRKVRESERSSNISTLQHSNLPTTVGESPEVRKKLQPFNFTTFQPFNNYGRKSGRPKEASTLQPFNKAIN